MGRRRHIVVHKQSSGCLLTAMKVWFVVFVVLPTLAALVIYGAIVAPIWRR